MRRRVKFIREVMERKDEKGNVIEVGEVIRLDPSEEEEYKKLKKPVLHVHISPSGITGEVEYED